MRYLLTILLCCIIGVLQAQVKAEATPTGKHAKAVNQANQRKATGEFHLYFFQLGIFTHIGVPNKASDLAKQENFITTFRGEEFERDFNDLLNSFESKKPKSRGLVDPRVVVVFKYEDGTSSYIAGNRFKYFFLNNKHYKDKEYSLYKLLSKYIKISDIEKLLIDQR